MNLLSSFMSCVLVSLQVDPTKEAQLQLLPQERVQNVKPCWETIPDEQRVELLSVDLNELKVKADDLAEKAKKQAGMGISLATPSSCGIGETSLPLVCTFASCMTCAHAAPCFSVTRKFTHLL